MLHVGKTQAYRIDGRKKNVYLNLVKLLAYTESWLWPTYNGHRPVIKNILSRKKNDHNGMRMSHNNKFVSRPSWIYFFLKKLISSFFFCLLIMMNKKSLCTVPEETTVSENQSPRRIWTLTFSCQQIFCEKIFIDGIGKPIDWWANPLLLTWNFSSKKTLGNLLKF